MLSRKCPKCGRIGQIRVERIFKATERRSSYTCAACGSSWTTADRPDRKPPKRKHTWLA
jgi:transposase-like protein